MQAALTSRCVWRTVALQSTNKTLLNSAKQLVLLSRSFTSQGDDGSSPPPEKVATKTENITSDLSSFSPREARRAPIIDNTPEAKLRNLVKEFSVMSDKPSSMAYFTNDTQYFELITSLDLCIAKYTSHLPLYSVKPKIEELKPADSRYVEWLNHGSLSNQLGMDLTYSQYNSLIARLDQLVGDSPSDLRKLPTELQEYIAIFSVSGALKKKEEKVVTLDSNGRAFAVGKRKEAAARVWLVEGEGEVVVNGRPISEYFSRLQDLKAALYPLGLTSSFGKFNAWVLARGGGTSGQAQAISLGISKALLIHDSSMKTILEEAGCLTKDDRRVERKKTGQPKARKNFTWVKR